MTICMIPPKFVDISNIRVQKQYLIKLKESSISFKCSPEDWQLAKHCAWWWSQELKCPVNEQDITYMQYVGITGKRLTFQTEKYNFMRDCYE